MQTQGEETVSGVLEISCTGWCIGVVHLSVVMICFNKNFWTLQKMGLYIRRLCVYLRRFIFSVYLCFTLSRTITFKTWSEMFICHHSLPNLLCTFSFPCSSTVSLRISSWAISSFHATCSKSLSLQFCGVLSFSGSSLWD